MILPIRALRTLSMLGFALILVACGAPPSFVGDAPPVQITQTTPDTFASPARFAVARVVYGQVTPPSAEEAALWEEIAAESDVIGTFTPLVGPQTRSRGGYTQSMLDTAIEQRFAYLLVVTLRPDTGSADMTIYHVGSGGIMATAQAVTTVRGQRGFFGGGIRNPTRLARVTRNIAIAARPTLVELLDGVAARQD